MKVTPFLLGMALLMSAVGVNERVHASEAPAGDPPLEQHASHSGLPSSTLVEQVREATEAFRHTIPDDYQQFLGCVSGPDQGAMGVHFVNFAVVDGKPEVKAPQALIYEVKDGRARLVGVEYIVPVEAWHPTEGDPPVPVLEGQVFHFNESPNRFGLPVLRTPCLGVA